MLQNQLLSLKIEETSGLPMKALHNHDIVKRYGSTLNFISVLV